MLPVLLHVLLVLRLTQLTRNRPDQSLQAVHGLLQAPSRFPHQASFLPTRSSFWAVPGQDSQRVGSRSLHTQLLRLILDSVTLKLDLVLDSDAGDETRLVGSS